MKVNFTTQALETVIFRSLKFLRRLGIFGIQLTQARLAQSVEHQTFNLRVAGSSPSSGDGNFEESKMVKIENKRGLATSFKNYLGRPDFVAFPVEMHDFCS